MVNFYGLFSTVKSLWEKTRRSLMLCLTLDPIGSPFLMIPANRVQVELTIARNQVKSFTNS